MKTKREFTFIEKSNSEDKIKATILSNVITDTHTIILESHVVPSMDNKQEALKTLSRRFDTIVNNFNRAFDNLFDYYFNFVEVPEMPFQNTQSAFLHFEIVLDFKDKKMNKYQVKNTLINIKDFVSETMLEDGDYNYFAKKVK